MQNWYDGMNDKQRKLVWIVSAGLILIYGIGIILCAILLYLRFGSAQEPSSQPSTPAIEHSANQNGPNMVLAYVLWAFLGWMGAHRFYLGRAGSACLQIGLTVISIGANVLATSTNADPRDGIVLIMSAALLARFVWHVLDATLIPGMVREERAKAQKRAVADMQRARKAGATHKTDDVSLWLPILACLYNPLLMLVSFVSHA